jgi:hypothetical protein
MKKYILIFSIMLAVTLAIGCTGSGTENGHTVSAEEQIKNDIDKESLMSDETNISYNSDNQALVITMFEKSYWDAENLKKVVFLDTVDILKVVAKHPEVKSVSIEYQTMLLDSNKNEVRERVFLVTFLTENTTPVNWENVYIDEQETFLRQKAESFWLHPAF